ncbi:MAG TPA: cysteine--tRNA ligase, partial [Candidatus Eisenbacteria bacterium]
ELAQRFMEECDYDFGRLNIRRPDITPLVTDHIEDIVAVVEKLVADGFAYSTPDGSVYFRVARARTFGSLTHQKLEDMRVGARVDPDERKEDPMDFALWKGAKEGEPAWESPWGRGRPGWHIECSAMAMKYLGETLDFHGGGQDLVFPHHENEKAQSEAATDRPFVRFWVENGMVNLGGEKMSKSTKHFFMIEDVLREFDPEVVRFYLQSTHYRSPIEWSEERLREAGAAYGRLRGALAAAARAESALGGARPDGGAFPERPAPDSRLGGEAGPLETAFAEAMDDDFNTARAQGHLFELAKALHRAAEAADGERESIPSVGRTLRRLGATIGLFWGAAEPEEELPEEVQALVRERDSARLRKQWKRADDLRDAILALGYVLEDQKGGTRARRRD